MSQDDANGNGKGLGDYDPGEVFAALEVRRIELDPKPDRGHRYPGGDPQASPEDGVADEFDPLLIHPDREGDLHGPGKAYPRHDAKVVTIFGAGISGLSAAHELIERGYDVQVIERKWDPHREYEVQVGGMAANQYAHVKAHPLALHRREFVAENADEIAHLRLPVHSRHIPPAPPAFGFPERIIMKRGDPYRGNDVDEYEVPNHRKIALVVDRLVAAIRLFDSLINWGFVGRGQDQKFAREVLAIDVVGFTHREGDPERSMAASLAHACAVRDEIIRLAPVDSPAPDGEPYSRWFEKILNATGHGAVGSAMDPFHEQNANRVEFSVVENRVPGEHGYRYFPAFYAHLFDTMKRIPLLTRRGNETHETVYDMLAPTPMIGVGLEDDGLPPAPERRDVTTRVETDRGITEVPRRRARNLEELRRVLELTMKDMEIETHDLVLFQLRMLQFLTSCTDRRRTYESVSWWDFLNGHSSIDEPYEGDGDEREDDEASACGRVVPRPSRPLRARESQFSEAAAYFLNETPRALMAMPAHETDARSHATIHAQLVLDDVGDGTRTDRTLNGPTSESWLRHWKQYLQRQGVRFFFGELEALSDKGTGPGRPRLAKPPVCDRQNTSSTFDPNADYYLLATPLWHAYDIVKSYEGVLDGDLEALREMGTALRVPTSPDHIQRRWSPEEGVFGEPWVPLEGGWIHSVYRDLVGLQFFYRDRLRLGEGHNFYPHAEWGLSSISQPPFWRRRMSTSDAFLGQVSVDIGNWYSVYRGPGPYEYEEKEPNASRRLSAWETSTELVANRTWKQIESAVFRRTPERIANEIQPDYFHIDENLSFLRESIPGPECTRVNMTPYLINPPGYWSWRPGRRSDEELDALMCERERENERLCAEGSRIVVPTKPTAGDEIRYQLTSFDVEREGGRGNRAIHWGVIGNHMATTTRLTSMESANESARWAVNTILELDGRLAGQECDIWPPDDREVGDFVDLKALDQELFDRNLPHFVEILGISTLTELAEQEDRDVVNAISASLRRGAGPLHKILDERVRAINRNLFELFVGSYER